MKISFLSRSLYACLFLLTGSCVERIDFTSTSTDAIPYINGYISDEYGYQFIELGELIPFSNNKNTILHGATVYVIDSENNRFDFDDQSSEYVSRIEFAAQENIDYTLYIEINGKSFKSTPQQLIKGDPITNFNFREEQVEVLNKENELSVMKGIVLQTELNNPVNSKKYYKFSVEYTYIFEAFRLPLGHPNKRCYNFEPPKGFILHENSTSGYSMDLKFLEYGIEVEYGISFLMRQVSMNEEAFDFWKQIKVQAENTGSIFDTPPYTIRGNMRSESDEDQMRGFFSVYSIQTKRIYTSQNELNYKFPAWIHQEECYPPRPMWPSEDCYNCLLNGMASTTNTKPIWWP